MPTNEPQLEPAVVTVLRRRFERQLRLVLQHVQRNRRVARDTGIDHVWVEARDGLLAMTATDRYTVVHTRMGTFGPVGLLPRVSLDYQRLVLLAENLSETFWDTEHLRITLADGTMTVRDPDRNYVIIEMEAGAGTSEVLDNLAEALTATCQPGPPSLITFDPKFLLPLLEYRDEASGTVAITISASPDPRIPIRVEYGAEVLLGIMPFRRDRSDPLPFGFSTEERAPAAG